MAEPRPLGINPKDLGVYIPNWRLIPCERVCMIGGKFIDFLDLIPHFERMGLEQVRHEKRIIYGYKSDYANGLYDGKPAGVIFGRTTRIYEREAEGLAKLDHPGIPKCYAVGEMQTPVGISGYMITDHFQGTTFKDGVEVSTEQGRERFKSHLSGLVDVMDYIHSKEIAHQDLYPEHVIVNENGVHLIDFHLWDFVSTGTPDFCGWRDDGDHHAPSIILGDYMEHPHGLAFNRTPWETPCFATMLQEIISRTKPGNKAVSYFMLDLGEIADYLLSRPDDFIKNPNSRDIVSTELKRMLRDLY